MNVYKPHGNHKPKTYKRYTKNKEKEIQTKHYRKPANHKGREQEKKEEQRRTIKITKNN